MKNLVFLLVSMGTAGMLSTLPVLSQSTGDGDPNNNSANPANGGGSYATGDSGSNNNSSSATSNPAIHDAPRPSMTNAPSTVAPTVTDSGTMTSIQPTGPTGTLSSTGTTTAIHKMTAAEATIAVQRSKVLPSGASPSTLPGNGGAPPVVPGHPTADNLGYSSTLPPSAGVPVVPGHPTAANLGYSSTLPPSASVPPVVPGHPTANNLGYSSTLPQSGAVPPVVNVKTPPHDLGYSSTLPDNGGVPPVIPPANNPEHAPTYPPSAQ